jgi:hypothetical protein
MWLRREKIRGMKMGWALSTQAHQIFYPQIGEKMGEKKMRV